MLAARERMLRYAYIGALTCALAGMNISYACYTALLPDLIAAPHMGRASGSMATMSMVTVTMMLTKMAAAVTMQMTTSTTGAAGGATQQKPFQLQPLL